jgi:hypothetical protein
MTRGQVRYLRRGLRCFAFVMSALACARMAWACSGGKGRVSDPAARDADGALELDPVGVDAGRGGRGAGQGADRVVGQQVAPDLLLDQVRAAGPQDFPGAAQVRFQLGVAALNRPPLMPVKWKLSLA